eukprot:gene17322-20293_t
MAAGGVMRFALSAGLFPARAAAAAGAGAGAHAAGLRVVLLGAGGGTATPQKRCGLRQRPTLALSYDDGSDGGGVALAATPSAEWQDLRANVTDAAFAGGGAGGADSGSGAARSVHIVEVRKGAAAALTSLTI